jgi:hypothetical protein
MTESFRAAECVITPATYAEAVRQAREMGALPNSILRGGGNLCGYLGELITLEYLRSIGVDVVQENTRDYDLRLTETNRTIDVKSKSCTSAPLAHYEQSVLSQNTVQLCDFYVFVRVQRRLTNRRRAFRVTDVQADDAHADNQLYDRAYIVGYLPKQAYFEQATIRRVDDFDASNGLRFRHECYNIQCDQLKSIDGIASDACNTHVASAEVSMQQVRERLAPSRPKMWSNTAPTLDLSDEATRLALEAALQAIR